MKSSIEGTCMACALDGFDEKFIGSSPLLFSSSYARGSGIWKGSFVKKVPLSEPLDLNGDDVTSATKKLSSEVLTVITDANAVGLIVQVCMMRNDE